MELIYEGKTKNVFKLSDGNLLLKLKDDATGKDGVFDPGENAVGLTIAGLGRESLKLSSYYFKLIQEKGIDTHFIDCDVEAATMTVKPASVFGKGLEVICRYKAVGSFFKRYGDYIEEGKALDAFVEMTLKDDARLDPVIQKETLLTLEIMSEEQYNQCVTLTKSIANIIKEDLASKGLILYDIKFEFGVVGGKVTLIDEISGGNMRVYKDGVIVHPMELAKLVI